MNFNVHYIAPPQCLTRNEISRKGIWHGDRSGWSVGWSESVWVWGGGVRGGNRLFNGMFCGVCGSVDVSDLPTHPLFSGDTRILQGSPAHPRRIASHPHLARLYERCAKRRSFPLIQSATGSWRRGNTVQRKLWGRKLGDLMKNTIFAEKAGADCSLLSRQGCHAPKFRGEKISRKATKPQICKS